MVKVTDWFILCWRTRINLQKLDLIIAASLSKNASLLWQPPRSSLTTLKFSEKIVHSPNAALVLFLALHCVDMVTSILFSHKRCAAYQRRERCIKIYVSEWKICRKINYIVQVNTLSGIVRDVCWPHMRNSFLQGINLTWYPHPLYAHAKYRLSRHDESIWYIWACSFGMVVLSATRAYACCVWSWAWLRREVRICPDTSISSLGEVSPGTVWKVEERDKRIWYVSTLPRVGLAPGQRDS